MKKSKTFNCTLCGKFIAYKDVEEGRVEVSYTPDIHFTVERMELTHKKCGQAK